MSEAAKALHDAANVIGAWANTIERADVKHRGDDIAWLRARERWYRAEAEALQKGEHDG